MRLNRMIRALATHLVKALGLYRENINPLVNRSVGSGIFRGRTEETIDPTGTFTYAEAATTLRNLLMEAELINRRAATE